MLTLPADPFKTETVETLDLLGWLLLAEQKFSFVCTRHVVVMLTYRVQKNWNDTCHIYIYEIQLTIVWGSLMLTPINTTLNCYMGMHRVSVLLSNSSV